MFNFMKIAICNVILYCFLTNAMNRHFVYFQYFNIIKLFLLSYLFWPNFLKPV